MDRELPIVIIGAGVAGLTAAIYLKRAGKKILVLEKKEFAGGRVSSTNSEGYILDRGFQVLLTEYPEVKALLDYSALDLKPFVPGALIFKGSHKMRLVDVMKRPSEAFSTIFSEVGTWADKFKVFRLSSSLKNKSVEDIFNSTEQPTLKYLINYGFSNTIIDRFFRPFLSGIFLEKELVTSSRMFEFVFKMFASGDAAIPARGMAEIPKQLLTHLDKDEIKMNTEVFSITDNKVTLSNGEIISAKAIITSIPHLNISTNVGSKSIRNTTNVYFTSNESPIKEGILVLNATPNATVNHFCVMSDVSKNYSYSGRALISVTMVGDYSHLEDTSIIELVMEEISSGFREAKSWEFLKTIHVQYALPNQDSVIDENSEDKIKSSNGLFQCGDFMLNGSINGAMKSGRQAAEAVVKSI